MSEVHGSEYDQDETVDTRIEAHLEEIAEERAASRQRTELVKFGILAGILLLVVLFIAVARPLIFGRIVPAIMAGDGSPAVGGEQPADGDNTQNLPIITVPDGGADDTMPGETGTGGQSQEGDAATEDQEQGDDTTTDTAAPTAVPGQIYVVQPGDTLNSIARQFNTTVDAVAAANHIENPDALLVGTTLTIPQP